MTEALKSLAEWKAFIGELEADPAELYAAAEAANSAPWVRTMMEKGASAKDVHAVLELFAQRFKALGFVPPAGGYVDLGWLAEKP